jgi:hypothetical protein
MGRRTAAGARGGGSNSAGFSSSDSADITASAPVCARHASTSANVRMLPFAITGTETACFTARIASQSASPSRLHARVLRQTAVLLRRRGWYTAGTAHH